MREVALPFRQHLEESVRTFFFKVRHLYLNISMSRYRWFCQADSNQSLQGQHRAKTIPPIPHRFVTDVDATLVQ